MYWWTLLSHSLNSCHQRAWCCHVCAIPILCGSRDHPQYVCHLNDACYRRMMAVANQWLGYAPVCDEQLQTLHHNSDANDGRTLQKPVVVTNVGCHKHQLLAHNVNYAAQVGCEVIVDSKKNFIANAISIRISRRMRRCRYSIMSSHRIRSTITSIGFHPVTALALA